MKFCFFALQVFKASEDLNSVGMAKFGWAFYDVDMEDYHDVCTNQTLREARGNRLQQARYAIKELVTKRALA